MKKSLIVVLAAVLVLAFATGVYAQFDVNSDINVVSREEGSGTRGAFVELLGVEEKDADGNKVDKTTEEATIVNGTSVVLTTVAGDPSAIGYISLGSLNDTVKAFDIDGVAASVENILSGEYKVFRPFNIATLAEISESAQDFVNFILSAEGQAIVEENKYIAVVADAAAYAGTEPTEKIVIGGSSSVTPLMEKLVEAYKAIYPNAEIEIQLSDSSTGMTSTIEGILEIGMASRELKDSEIEAGLTPIVIANDGIAIIGNLENTISALTSEQVKGIYTGVITTWAELE